MKFPNLSIMTGLDIDTVVVNAVAKFVRTIVLLFVDIFKLDNFTGSTILLLHAEPWVGTGNVDLV